MMDLKQFVKILKDNKGLTQNNVFSDLRSERLDILKFVVNRISSK